MKRTVAQYARSLRGLAWLAIVVLSGCAGGASNSFTPRCATPNVAAQVVYIAFPYEPPIAIQQGITGNVGVLVGLDSASHVVTTSVISSPSQLLNESALAAARKSTFSTAIVDCEAVASTVQFIAKFPVASLPPPGP